MEQMVSRKDGVEIANCRLDRERDFYDHLAETGFQSHWLFNRMNNAFYNKDANSIVWGPVWRDLDLVAKTVLDYGCGPGDFSMVLAGRGAIVYGMDISGGMIDMARREQVSPGLNKPEFIVGDAHQTGLPDSYFDYVFGNGILHHLDLERAYAEIVRILKPGGKAYFLEALSGHPLIRLVRWMARKLHTIDERPLSFEDIARASRFFNRVQHSEYFLLAVAAAPLNLINFRIANIVIKLFNSFDQTVSRVIPGCRRFAWVTLLELVKE